MHAADVVVEVVSIDRRGARDLDRLGEAADLQRQVSSTRWPRRTSMFFCSTGLKP